MKPLGSVEEELETMKKFIDKSFERDEQLEVNWIQINPYRIRSY